MPKDPASPKKTATGDEDPAIKPWLYPSPADALKAVHERFNYWSAKLTDSSYTLSLAVIGANWAVFGSVDKVLHNVPSELSLLCVILGLGINLVGVKYLAEAHSEQVGVGECDHRGWEAKFLATLGKPDPFPYTEKIVKLARFLRECRVWLPLLGGIFFLVALFIPNRAGETSPRPQGLDTGWTAENLPEFSCPRWEWSRLGLEPRNADGMRLPHSCGCEMPSESRLIADPINDATE